MRLRRIAALVFMGVTVLVAPVASVAQEASIIRSPILAIDSERLFADSMFGKRVALDFETQGLILEAENRRIEGELSAEERDLTEKRPTMAPDMFRSLADAFDAKVQRIRSEQNAKARTLTQRGDVARRQFLQVARRTLEGVMQEAGAAVIVEQRSVFMSASIIDVTDVAISRIDADIGEGRDLPVVPETEQGAPDQPGPVAPQE